MSSSDAEARRAPSEGCAAGVGISRRSPGWGRVHELCDRVTEWLLWAMVVFSPWAFGTTQAWSMRIMNEAGYCLGALLLGKVLLRRISGFSPDRWDADRRSRGVGRLLAVISFLILGYCLLSALNARATYRGNSVYDYFKCIPWLPHSYDAGLTWGAFWNYLALALDFWAARDWLLTKDAADRTQPLSPGARPVPTRLRRLLWVISLNGALLATEGLVQRALGGGRLLWLVEPRINKLAEAQFGPYAYRSNAVQYVLLVWPLTLGFWYLMRRRTRRSEATSSKSNNLLPCLLVMGMVPFMSLSRAGAMIGMLVVLSALGIFVVQRESWQRKRIAIVGVAWVLVAALLLGTGLEWDRLGKRFQEGVVDVSRLEIWRNTWAAFKDHPVFGTGPGTFSSIYNFYYSSATDEGMAQAHNDWLELLMTFGVAGAALVLAALFIVLRYRAVEGGIHLGRTFPKFIYIALGSCLLFATVDFPLTIYSVLFLFLIECAILFSLSVPENGLNHDGGRLGNVEG